MALIEITEADPRWPGEFEAVASALDDALGALAVRIDHIGSTAVPGLAAKDIIDVQVTVDSFGEDVVDALVTAGFSHQTHITNDLLTGCDDPAELRKFLFRERSGERRANIHVRQAGRANQRYALLFRDHLRADDVVRDAYAELKRVLAREYPDDADGYYDVKDPAMDIIYRGAEHWAAATGWTL